MTVLTKDPVEATPPASDAVVDRPRPERGRRRKRRPWLIALGVFIVLWLLVFVIPAYVTLDQSKSRVDIRPDVAFHYTVLIVHIATSMIALLAAPFQMSARLRARRPKVHRTIGRIYLFGGVFPGGLAALTLVAINIQGSPRDIGLSIAVGNTMWAFLWLGTAIAGLRYARQRRFADHRRMMIYMFALTLAILWTRFMAVAAFGIPGFPIEWFTENVGWVPWVVNLLVAQWWLNRTAPRPVVVPASVTPA